MKYVRPFSLNDLAPGEAGPWLLGPDEAAGCTIHLRRGGGAAAPNAAPTVERFALVLQGVAQAVPGHGQVGEPVAAGGVLFLPQGCSAAVTGSAESLWLEIETTAPAEAAGEPAPVGIVIDESKFQGAGFAHQSILDRAKGARTLRMNAMRVGHGAGSPDFHIHAFTQMYVIQVGEMTVDVGRSRFKAPANSIVYLPAGIVHRNFNASGAIERHVSLLLPEPRSGEIFDYAVTIHEREAEFLTSLPA